MPFLQGGGTFQGEGAGTKIAFVSTRDGNSEIYIMNADGTGVTRLTNNAAFDWAPAFSPDGSKVAFASDSNGNSEIYVIDADGSEQTRLTNDTAFDSHPVFSPDGSKIAFTSNRDRNAEEVPLSTSDSDDEIYIMNADGTGVTRLTNNKSIDIPSAFSPDGSKIAFARSRVPTGVFIVNFTAESYVYVMNTDGTGQTRLTNGAALDYSPAFSPDGTKIVYASYSAGETDIYVMNADGSGQTNLTNNAGYDRAPAFSPDGSKIAFESNRDGNYEIYIMNADGTGVMRLTNNSAFDSDPSFPLRKKG